MAEVKDVVIRFEPRSAAVEFIVPGISSPASGSSSSPAERVRCDFWFVDDVEDPNNSSGAIASSWVSEHGSHQVAPAAPSSLPGLG